MIAGMGVVSAVVRELVGETPYRWRIEPTAGMRVPGVVSAFRELLPGLAADRPIAQVANVATLPGIVDASYAMPDMHWLQRRRPAARVGQAAGPGPGAEREKCHALQGPAGGMPPQGVAGGDGGGDQPNADDPLPQLVLEP